MSDDYMKEQIRRMIAFIDQEASEKVEEIDAKAEEEFIVEKTSILQKERERLSELYKKKQKAIELEMKREVCTIANESRLSKLKVKEEILSQLKDEVHRSVQSLSNERYKEFLRFCIDEGVSMIEQPEVIKRRLRETTNAHDVKIRCRKQDVPVVKDLLIDLKNVSLDQINYIASQSAGGVIVSAINGRIEVDNSLETRTQIAIEKAIPTLRTLLFGPNPHRTFLE